MAYQVLARKWRPKRFQDVIGQTHITRSLQNAITAGRVGHAYLLTGTRGIGKTSVARIFAKSLRCEKRLEDANPCGECLGCKDFDSGSSMNFIEVDGASNNSVENIRDIVSNAQYAQTAGMYKIYLIDEVHMLSGSAFNALLKTLEEPPEHVIFIFATTEPSRVIPTVLSRCQRFDFRNATIQDLVAHVKEIAKKEEITFESERLIEQLCHQGRGSVRDTLSLLDQILSFAPDKFVDEKTLSSSLGVARSSAISELVESIMLEDKANVSRVYRTLLAENVSAKNTATALLDHLFETIENIDHPDRLRELNLVDPEKIKNIGPAELIWIFETIAKDAAWIMETLLPEKAFALLLQKVTQRRENLAPRESRSNSSEKPNEIQAEEVKKKTIEEAPKLEPAPASEPVQSSQELNWKGFLDFLRKESPPTATYVMHGNLTTPVDFYSSETPIDINLGFGEKDELMYEYMLEKEMSDRLRQLVANYTGKEPTDFALNVELVKSKEAEEKKFVSVADIKKQEVAKIEEDTKNNFLNHPTVLEAQKMFRTQIDKVVLKNKNEDNQEN